MLNPHRIARLFLILILVLLPAVIASAETPPGSRRETQQRRPTGLMCELMSHPERTTIFDPQPEFSWIVPLERRGSKQTAYQIIVDCYPGSSAEKDEVVWDSGKVESEQSVAVEYKGKPLASQRSYQWKVRTWNENGKPSVWSRSQRFCTGTLRTGKDTGSDFESRRTTPWYPLVQTEVAPVKVVKKGPGHWFVDFGRAAYGTIKLNSVISDNDGQITLHLGERPGPDNTVDRDPGGTIRYRATTIPLKKGTHDYRAVIPKDKRNTGGAAVKMPPEVGEVLPFRYCEVVGYPGELTADAIRQVRVHYPFDDGAATFESSSKVLNDVWELCKYSMMATSFCGVYVDGDRERIPYEADAYINQLSQYCADREFTLARYSHEYLILHPTWPTEWPLHSVLIAWADYMHTGDLESAEEFYDDLKAKTLIALAREDGLISTRTGLVTPEVLKSIHGKRLDDIVDWPKGERDGYDFRPINTVVNAMHYRTLVIMSNLAAALGKDADAKMFEARAEKVTKAINDKLFNADTGLYVDGEGSTHSSLHANMFPLAMGVVPKERRAKVAEFTAGKGMACSVYAAQYLLEALFDAGAAETGLKRMIDTTTDRSWPHMIYDVGTTITLEAWDNKYKPNQDWNHAWGAAPGNIIPRKLMGIEPLEPGFKKVRICPKLGSLEEASMTLPTVRGPIGVEYRKTDKGGELAVSIPANMVAEVHLPVGDANGFREGGRPAEESECVKFERVEDGRAVFLIGSGDYRFTWGP